MGEEKCLSECGGRREMSVFVIGRGGGGSMSGQRKRRKKEECEY